MLLQKSRLICSRTVAHVGYKGQFGSKNGWSKILKADGLFCQIRKLGTFCCVF